MIQTVAVEGYRTLRDLVVDLGQLTVVTGANGSGKSNFFRALRLLAACGQGRVVGALAAEGGLPSTLWAGPQHGTRPGGITEGTRRTGPVALRLGFSGPDLGYAIDLGLPQTSQDSPFALDPEIKTETVWSGGVLRPATLQAERRRGHVRTRDDAGRWTESGRDLRTSESMIDEFVDDTGAPEMLRVRRDLRDWRFYDQFRTDPHAPARAAHIGTQTPVLADDGADLAAALATIQWMSADGELERAVDDAFPGSELQVTSDAGSSVSRCTSPVCSAPCRRPSSRTGRCVTCCCSQPSGHRDRPSCWSSTSPRRACTRTCCRPSRASCSRAPSARRPSS